MAWRGCLALPQALQAALYRWRSVPGPTVYLSKELRRIVRLLGLFTRTDVSAACDDVWRQASRCIPGRSTIACEAAGPSYKH